MTAPLADEHSRPSEPRRFVLHRDMDVTGVSGTGDVAEGVEWSDGTVALRWRGRWATTVVWDYGVDALLAVHGHQGATIIRWLDTNPASPVLDATTAGSITSTSPRHGVSAR